MEPFWNHSLLLASSDGSRDLGTGRRIACPTRYTETVNDIFSLAGKTALVAGASRGIGLAIAQGLADARAHTVLAARSMDKLEAHARALLDKGQSASALLMDM